jgi:hypothetical protein
MKPAMNAGGSFAVGPCWMMPIAPFRFTSILEGQLHVDRFWLQSSRLVPPTVAARHPIPVGSWGHMHVVWAFSKLQ